MKKTSFSWFALGLGSFVAMVLLGFEAAGAGTGQGLPLLTSLFLAEFGFVVSAAGAVLGFGAWRAAGAGGILLLSPIACATLSLGFAWVGVSIWIGSVAS